MKGNAVSVFIGLFFIVLVIGFLSNSVSATPSFWEISFTPSWWNASWQYRQNMTVGAGWADVFSKQPVYAWLNGTDGHLTNCNEIRITNITGQEIPRSIVHNQTSGNNYNCRFVFQASRKIVNGTSEDYIVYYGNNGAGEKSYTNDLRQTGTQNTQVNSFFVDGNTNINFTIRKGGGMINKLYYLTSNEPSNNWVSSSSNWFLNTTPASYSAIFDCATDIVNTNCTRTVNESVFNTYTCKHINAENTYWENITIFNEIPIIQNTFYLKSEGMWDWDIRPYSAGTKAFTGFNQITYDVVAGALTVKTNFDFVSHYPWAIPTGQPQMFVAVFNETKILDSIALLLHNPVDLDARVIFGENSSDLRNGNLKKDTLIDIYWILDLNSTSTGYYRMPRASELDAMLTDQVPAISYGVQAYQINVTDCSTGRADSSYVAMNMFLKNEDDLTSVVGRFDYMVRIWHGDETYYRNYSFYRNNTINTSLCIYPAWEWLMVDLTAQYSASGYSIRSYYYESNITNQTQFLDFFLLKNAYSYPAVFFLRDQWNNPQLDYLIDIQRLYLGNNSYKTVAVCKSDDPDGKCTNYLNIQDVFYKYIVRKDGVIALETSPSVIICNPFESISSCPPYPVLLKISTTGVANWFKYIGKIAYSCSVNEATDTLRCTVADTSGLVSSYNLYVIKRNNLLWDTLCNQNETSSAVTFTCALGNRTGNLYYYSLQGYMSFPPAMISSDYLDYTSLGTEWGWGSLGYLMAFLLIGTLFFVGIYNPVVALSMAVLGVIVSFYLNLLPIGVSSVVTVALIVAIMIWRARA